MHSNDVMTENTLNFLNQPNELSGKMAVDTKELQWKVIAENVNGYDFFFVLPTGFGLNVKLNVIHNPHISQSPPLYQNEHLLQLSEFAIVLFTHA